MHRRVVVAVLVGAVASLVGPGPALANLATLAPSSEVARPGDVLTLVGSSFVFPRDPAVSPTPVTVHWRTIDGPVLAEVVPNRSGMISASITVPESPAGHVLVVATQRRTVPVNADEPDGPVRLVDEFGTPARTSIRVLAPGEPAEAPPPRRSVSGSADLGISPTLLVLIVLSGGVAMSLFGGAVIAVLHHARTRALPEPWRPPGW